jgi:hypothetical protein
VFLLTRFGFVALLRDAFVVLVLLCCVMVSFGVVVLREFWSGA